jgi:hypothetical protein
MDNKIIKEVHRRLPLAPEAVQVNLVAYCLQWYYDHAESLCATCGIGWINVPLRQIIEAQYGDVRIVKSRWSGRKIHVPAGIEDYIHGIDDEEDEDIRDMKTLVAYTAQ